MGKNKIKFVNEEHKIRFEELVTKGAIVDKERKKAMYILGGVPGLYLNVCDLYDFKENHFIYKRNIEDECVEWNAKLSNAENKLALLALSYFASKDEIGIIKLLNALDKENIELVLNSIDNFYL